MSPKISIIVPVYNVESFLPKCLDSIINQTMTDIEIILVDDGSTDGSEIICDDYARQDDRIQVIHKINEGLSAARNDGIDMSSAPYIIFIDADDWVEPELCKKTLTAAIDNEADLVLYAFNKIYKNGKIIPYIPFMNEGVLTKEDAIKYNMQYAPAIWLGLYSRRLFTNTKFPVGKLFEEIGTSHRYKHVADRIILIKEILYNYRIDRPGSIISTFLKTNHQDLKEMQLRRIDDLCEWGYEELARNDAISLLIRHGCKDQEHLIDIVKKGSAEYSWKRKIMASIIHISPKLFDAVCILARKRYK